MIFDVGKIELVGTEFGTDGMEHDWVDERSTARVYRHLDDDGYINAIA